MATSNELWEAYKTACADLLAERTPDGHWEGRLASSALATATAIGALALVQRHGGGVGPETCQILQTALQWLADTQNPDGGWGDTDRSPSNIATTMLVRAAVHLAEFAAWAPANVSAPRAESPARQLAGLPVRFVPLLDRATRYIDQQGGLEGLRRRYGKDQTFAVPILTMYALAGLVGWKEVRPLPFEWAVLPHQILGCIRLPVVSYAIPALVAMGQARFFHLPPKNPLVRWLRAALVEKTLQVLEAKQPASGGFLEAVPLTSFVMMALASTGRACHPVVQRGIDFLLRTYRPEGAWPIDTNLATWVTTLSLNALLGPIHRSPNPQSVPPHCTARLGRDRFAKFWATQREIAWACWPWLLECQHRKIHPFTHSPPGGWGWSDLPGAVPDADDTAGALLALAAIYQLLHQELFPQDRRRILEAVGLGLRWLLDLQNRDGGWPTFCRGWGALPFDRSATDLTAHVLRALAAWKNLIRQALFDQGVLPARGDISEAQLQRAIHRGLAYLSRRQNPDGSWTPLWFGNPYWPEEENPIYGTARVLLAYRDLGLWDHPAAQRGRRWLLAHQNPDGGWGGRPSSTTHTTQNPSKLQPGHWQNMASVSDDAHPPSHQPGEPSQPSDWQSSVEETALALEALLADPQAINLLAERTERNSATPDFFPPDPKSPAAHYQRSAWQKAPGPGEQHRFRSAVEQGLAWLVWAIQEGRHRQPEPIGLYFARLWYYEEIYPLAFAVSALGQALRYLAGPECWEP